MKNSAVALSLALVTLLSLPLKAADPSYNSIIFFGDSLSDNGNFSSMLFGYLPESPPYYPGRFTNGQTWAETVADHFNKENHIASENYAFAGTTAVYHSPFDGYVPHTLTDEIDSFLLHWLFSDKDKSLFIIWIGGNDYIAGDSDIDARTSAVIKAIKANVETLIQHGGKHFLLMNLPDLSKSPEGQRSITRQNISDLTITHNKKLALMITDLQNKYRDININLFDVYTGFNELIQNPEKYNLLFQTKITNSFDACWKGGYRVRSMEDHQQTDLTAKIEAKLKQQGHSRRSNALDTAKAQHAQAVRLTNHIFNTPDLSVAYDVGTQLAQGEKACVNPENYVFWDKMHPSAATHSIFSARMIEFITQYYP